MVTIVQRRFRQARSALLFTLFLIAASPAHAVTVSVKYVGLVDLAAFDCSHITRSSFIRTVCHERSSATTVVQLNATWYQYCGMSNGMIQDWLSA